MLLIKKKASVIFLLSIFMTIGFKLYSNSFICEKYICDFDLQRDKEGLLDIFKKNWRALTGEDSFSSDSSEYVENIMQNRLDKTTPSIGLFDIKVMREGDILAGFTTYYRETAKKGMVLFLAVGHDFRGKGYGKLLMQHAIKDLLSQGSQYIGIWVAETNFPARRIYEGLGFCETSIRKDKVIYLEHCP